VAQVSGDTAGAGGGAEDRHAAVVARNTAMATAMVMKENCGNRERAASRGAVM
jgi:hypothetical protein